MNGPFMVFDVESGGLHGPGFAVGWVVVDRTGKALADGRASCALLSFALLPQETQDWLAAHCGHLLEHATHYDIRHLRDDFWRVWDYWKAQGATLWADCAWPVEARFLAACVDDQHRAREWDGPYPLHEIATLMLAAGRDPSATYPRLPTEEPAHDPLADARQSARLLIECLDALDAARPQEE